MRDGIKFHDSLANSWNKAYKAGGFKRRIAFFSTILERHVKPGDLWFDAGCGTGNLARLISRLGGRVIAVDGSPLMIEFAKNETSNTGSSITYKLVDSVESLDFLPSSFDNALSSSVIEYVDDPVKMLGELFKIIRPSGVLIMSAPNRLAPVRLLQKTMRSILGVFGIDVYPYLAVSKNDYSRRSFKRVIEGTGFIVDEIIGFDPILPVVMAHFDLGSLFITIARKPGPSCFEEPRDEFD